MSEEYKNKSENDSFELIRESVLIYRSFYKNICELKTTEEQIELYNALFNFAFDAREPENLSYSCRLIWNGIRPQIRANNYKYVNGCKGGRPPINKAKRTVTKIKASEKPPQRKTHILKPNENENVYVSSSLKKEEEIEASKFSTAQKILKNAFPDRIIDTEIDEQTIDVYELINGIKRSKFLQNAVNFKKLSTLLKYYNKIKRGGFDTYMQVEPPKTVAKIKREYKENKFTKEQLEGIYANLDELLDEENKGDSQ